MINLMQSIKKYKEEIFVCAIFIFFALGFNVYRVESDGKVYYALLEYTLHLPNPESFPSGYYKPVFQQSGCAYFNMPFYIIAYLFEKLFHAPLNFNGITVRQIAINLASNFYMVLSLILSVKILKKFNFKYIVLPILSILFSTSAFTIAVVQPSFSHAVDIFLITLFVYLFLINEEKSPKINFWLGALTVIMTLVRYFNFVFIFPLIVYYITQKEYLRIKYLLLGFLSFIWLLPTILYFYNIYDQATFLASNNNYFTRSIVGLSFFPKYFFHYLIHPLHGLFIWSPVTILSAIGLLVFPKTKEKLGYVYIGMWFMLELIYGFVYFWHGGWSFSNRYLVGLFPIFIIGLAALLEKYRKKIVLLILIMTFYSLVLYVNWRLNIIHGEYGVPQDMIKAWRKGEAEAFYDKKVNLKNALNRLYETCRYKYLFKIIK